MCQYCGIELFEDREVANETCYGCMQRFSTEFEKYLGNGVINTRRTNWEQNQVELVLFSLYQILF